jgi:hypothetical protein
VLILIAVAAGVSRGDTGGPAHKVSRDVDIGPQIQGLQLSWMDIELGVRDGDSVAWDWEADGPVRFYIVSPTGAILASVDDKPSSVGSAVIGAAGECTVAWTNPSFREPVHLRLTVEVKGGLQSTRSPTTTDDGGDVATSWQWVPDVAVALLLLLACEVSVAVPMLLASARVGPRLARKSPIDYTDAYFCLGPDAVPVPDGRSRGAPAQARPMEGALSVVRVARR